MICFQGTEERIRLFKRGVSRVQIILFYLFTIQTLLSKSSLQTTVLLIHKVTLQSPSNKMIPTMFSFNQSGGDHERWLFSAHPCQ